MKNIGNGFFANVYETYLYHKNTPTVKIPVAFKSFTKINNQSKLMLEKETEILRAVAKYQTVVTIFKVYPQHNGFACELAKFGSLKNVIRLFKEKNINDPTYLDLTKYRVKFACDIAKALNAINIFRIVHCDLKSSNILVREEFDGPCAIISDFGISKMDFPDQPECVNNYIATQAPEILDKGKQTAASDIFCYAIILWEMLTLEEPVFYDQSDGHLLNYDEVRLIVLKGDRLPLPKPETISNSDYRTYVNIINNCWHPLPEKRIPATCDYKEKIEIKLQNTGEFKEFFYPYPMKQVPAQKPVYSSIIATL